MELEKIYYQKYPLKKEDMNEPTNPKRFLFSFIVEL